VTLLPGSGVVEGFRPLILGSPYGTNLCWSLWRSRHYSGNWVPQALTTVTHRKLPPTCVSPSAWHATRRKVLMASSQPALTSLARPSYAGFGRRLGAHLLDVVIAYSVVVVVGIAMRILHAFGLWMPSTQGLPLEEVLRALRFGAKLLIVLALCPRARCNLPRALRISGKRADGRIPDSCV
jgi:hypothetical protein